MKRNGKLDFLKFVFAIFIMSYHYQWYPLLIEVGDEKLRFAQNGGYAVTFFFLVSGAFFAASAKAKSNEAVHLADDTQKFLSRKFKYFIKWYLCAIVLYFMEDIFMQGGLKKALSHLFYTIPSLFLLGQTGFDNKDIYVSGYYIGASWYLSALFLILMVFYPFIRLNYGIFTKIMAPLIFVGTLYINLGILHNTFMEGKLYSWCVVSLGIIIYEQCGAISNICHNKAIWGGLEIALYGVTFAFLCLGVNPKSMIGYPMLFIYAFAVIISLSGITDYKIFSYKWCTFLGEVSFPLYMLHTPIFRWYEDIYTFLGIKAEGIGIYFPAAITSMLGAVIVTLISRKTVRKKELQRI